MDDEKQETKQPNQLFWGLFITAMGIFGAYNLYKALQSFGMIE